MEFLNNAILVLAYLQLLLSSPITGMPLLQSMPSLIFRLDYVAHEVIVVVNKHVTIVVGRRAPAFYARVTRFLQTDQVFHARDFEDSEVLYFPCQDFEDLKH